MKPRCSIVYLSVWALSHTPTSKDRGGGGGGYFDPPLSKRAELSRNRPSHLPRPGQPPSPPHP
jgi:hypothetical protein